MQILITGLGQSKPTERPEWADYCIGVNDAPEWVDEIVCVDPPRVFSKERLETIVNHPALFNSHCDEWVKLRQCSLFALNPQRHYISHDIRKGYWHSITSIVPAICHAYNTFGDKQQYYLAGVDLIDHKSLSSSENVNTIAATLLMILKVIDLKFFKVAPNSPLQGLLTLSDVAEQNP